MNKKIERMTIGLINAEVTKFIPFTKSYHQGGVTLHFMRTPDEQMQGMENGRKERRLVAAGDAVN